MLPFFVSLILPNVIEIDTTSHVPNSFKNSSELSNRSSIISINLPPNYEQITPDKFQINNNKISDVISNTSVNIINNEANEIQMTNEQQEQQEQQQTGTKRSTKETNVNLLHLYLFSIVKLYYLFIFLLKNRLLFKNV